jgi:hypothetical protein
MTMSIETHILLIWRAAPSALPRGNDFFAELV